MMQIAMVNSKLINMLVQFSSVAQLCLTPCHPMDCSTPGLLSITNSRSLLKLMPLSRWCHPTTSSSVVPFFSCLQSFPASGSFQMSQLFSSGGQSIGVSASTSVLPMNIQDWFPLGLTDSVSLQSKGLSRVFFNTTVLKHQFLGAQLNISYTNNWASLVAQPYYWFWDFSFSALSLEQNSDSVWVHQ